MDLNGLQTSPGPHLDATRDTVIPFTEVQRIVQAQLPKHKAASGYSEVSHGLSMDSENRCYLVQQRSVEHDLT